MPRKRPTPVLVIAIFHFIFAGLSACGFIFAVSGAQKGLAKMQGANNPQERQFQEKLERAMEEVPGYKGLAEVGGIVVSGLMAVVLVVAGFGLLNMQPWGRTLSVIYAVFSILYQIVSLVFAFVFLVPALQPVFQELAQQNREAAKVAEVAMIGALAVGGGCGLIYPIAVLIVMLLPNVSAAFRAPVTEELPPPEDDEDQYEPGERGQR